MKLRSILLLVLCCAPTLSRAQWTKIAPNLISVNPGSNAQDAMSFKDGLLWIATENLYLSTDSGMSWSKPCQNVPWNIAYDIQFFDRQQGIIASDNGAWLTMDQGVSWANIGGNQVLDACFGNSSNIIAIGSDGNLSGITTDGGATWQNSNQSGYWLSVVFLKSGLFLFQLGGTICSTQDFGVSWQTATGVIHADSYTFAVDSCDQNLIYFPSENFSFKTDNTSQLYRSSDRGNSWDSPLISDIPFLCGSVSLSTNAAYCQTITNGVFRSTDRGITWNTIAGPTNQFDTRMIVAINDNIVVAADADGNIWKTTNSGGDSVTASLLTTSLSSTQIENDTIGSVILVPIKIGGAGYQGSLDFSLRFDTSMLVYKGTYLSDTSKIDLTTARAAGFARLHFDSASTLYKDSIIGYATFQIFPTTTPCTTVLFDSISITNGKGFTCATVNPSFTATICSEVGCGTTTLTDFLRYGKVPTLSIIPNPASEVTTVHSNVDLGQVEIELYDVLGNLVMSTSDIISPSHPASLNLTSLPSGLLSIHVQAAGIGLAQRLMHLR